MVEPASNRELHGRCFRGFGTSSQAIAEIEGGRLMVDAKKIPMQLQIVAALFIVMGLNASISLLLSLLYGEFHLSLGIMGLPVGVGLLRGRRHWLTWSRVLIAVGLVWMPITTLLLLTGESWARISLFGYSLGYQSDGLWIGLLWNFVWFALNLWQFRALTRPDVRRFFGLTSGSRLSFRRWALLCCALPLLVVPLGALLGVRLSAEQAARAHFAVPDDAVLVEEVDLDWGMLHVFQGADTICTTGSYRAAGFWRSPVSSLVTILPDDAVSTLGYFGWSTRYDRQVTILIVQTSDPHVAAIEAGPEGDRRRHLVSAGDTVYLQWDQAGLFVSDLAATALDSEGRVLYEYRYPHTSTQRADELRWYPVNAAVSAI